MTSCKGAIRGVFAALLVFTLLCAASCADESDVKTRVEGAETSGIPSSALEMAEPGEYLDITPTSLASSGTPVIKNTSTGATYIIVGGGAYLLGESGKSGAYGVVDMLLCDLDKNGRNELVFTYSYGENLHYASVGCFDFADNTVHVADYMVFDSDIVIGEPDETGILPLYAATVTSSAVDGREYTDLTMQRSDPLAGLSYSGGVLSVQ